MTPAAFALLALLPTAEPVEVHDVLLHVGNEPAVRLRLKIELDGKPLTQFDAAAHRDRDAFTGKPGAGALDRLMPDGTLLRVEAVPAAPHHAALSKAIFDALDTDRNGKLSAAELAAAEKVLLAKFDHDDDECITALELVPDLQTVVPSKAAPAVPVRVSAVKVEGKADLERTLKLGHVPAHASDTIGAARIEFFTRLARPDEKVPVPKSLLAEGRGEIKAAFERAATGVVSLTVVPGPVGLFDLIDADRDGQLSVAELRAVKTVLADRAPGNTAVSLVIVPGAAKPPVVPLLRTFARAAGPEWFRAMDKNGDGYVSAREFLGTPEQFRKLDRNGDGLIDPDEAERAEKR